jgi:hypothetical protein
MDEIDQNRQKKIASTKKLLAKLKQIRAAPKWKRIFLWIPPAWKWSLICYKDNVLTCLRPTRILETIQSLLCNFFIAIGSVFLVPLYLLSLLFYLPLSFCINWFQHARMTDQGLDNSIERWQTDIENYELSVNITENVETYELKRESIQDAGN